MHKQRFGKGPETCLVTVHANGLTVFIRNYITPAEEVLIEANKTNLAYEFRNTVIEKVINEFVEEATSLLHIPFTSYYCDWDYHKNSGLIVIDKNERIEVSSNSTLKTKLIEKINEVSSAVHKVPESIHMIKISHNMIAVECVGTILEIEKVLYNKGCTDILQEQAREIKKSYINKKHLFEKVFDRLVEGLFITWDYENDRNYIFFYLQ